MRLPFFCTVFLCSCSLVVPADDPQCESSDDCVARGFVDAICEDRVCVPMPVDPVWGCLGMIEEPMPTPGATHLVTNTIVDAISGGTPRGLSLRLCSGVDLNCESPVQDDVPHDEGVVSLTVQSGFQGYLEIDSETTMPALLPIGPVVADESNVELVQLVSTSIVDLLARTAGFEVDPESGHVLTLLTGCERIGRAGVSFTSNSESGTPFYLVDLAPDVESTESADSGNGGVLNVEPGFVTLETTRASTGEFISTKRVLVREGTITYIVMTPTPDP